MMAHREHRAVRQLQAFGDLAKRKCGLDEQTLRFGRRCQEVAQAVSCLAGSMSNWGRVSARQPPSTALLLAKPLHPRRSTQEGAISAIARNIDAAMLRRAIVDSAADTRIRCRMKQEVGTIPRHLLHPIEQEARPEWPSRPRRSVCRRIALRVLAAPESGCSVRDFRTTSARFES